MKQNQGAVNLKGENSGSIIIQDLETSEGLTIFRGDIQRYKEFQAFLFTTQNETKLIAGQYRISPMWQRLYRHRFVAISYDSMLYYGPRFNPPNKILKRLKRYRNLKKFRQYYPKCDIPNQLYHRFPVQTLRLAEAIETCPITPSSILEVGAWNCNHIARHFMVKGLQRATVIDLPDSIFVGSAFLESLGISTCLPNENLHADVTFRLPYQKILGEFDLGFNSGSFAEMEIDVVNAYLKLLSKHCTAIQTQDFCVSKQFPDTRLENYDWVSEKFPSPYLEFAHPKATSQFSFVDKS